LYVSLALPENGRYLCTTPETSILPVTYLFIYTDTLYMGESWSRATERVSIFDKSKSHYHTYVCRAARAHTHAHCHGNGKGWRFSANVIYIYCNPSVLYYIVCVCVGVCMCVCTRGVSVQRQQLLLYIIHAGWTYCVRHGRPSVGRSVVGRSVDAHLDNCHPTTTTTTSPPHVWHSAVELPRKRERGPWWQ